MIWLRRLGTPGLVARLYLFGILQLLVVMVALPWLTRWVIRPRFDQFGLDFATIDRYLQQNITPRWSDRTALDRELRHARGDLHLRVTLYAPDGSVFATNTTPPLPLRAPESIPSLPLPRAAQPPGAPPGPPPMFGGPLPMGPRTNIFALASPPGALAVISRPPFQPPDRAFFGWAIVVALVASALLAVVLARSFATPLQRLADAARALGEGNLETRTGVTRNDEFGTVARAFDLMADRVAAMIQAHRELLANVSHELRTPLARIHVALDIAEEAKDPEAISALLVDVRRDAAELEQLVNDVLDNARLDLGEGRGGAGVPVLRPEAVALHGFVAQAQTRFAQRHGRRQLEVQIVEPLGTAAFDEGLVRRAIDNVLDNAAKYSDAESVVTLRAQMHDGVVTFDIIDRGIGIDTADLARVGTPFFRTDRSRVRATGGIGLGLSFSRRIAEAHGGTLELVSERGHGTTVTIRLQSQQLDA